MSYFNYQSRMGLMPVSPGVLIAAQEHAKSISFEEVCGVVIGDTYHPMTNLATSPTEHFEIDPQEYLGIQAKMGGAKLQAIIHSHPDGDACPSEHDMVQQLAWGVPWGIIAMRDHAVRDVVFFGDGCPIAPYERRPFKHGVFDCYNLARDWYKQEMDITLKQYPRRDHWWTGSDRDNLLQDHFTDAGFVQIGLSDLRRGDAIMGSVVGQGQTNHCAVYLGNELILHHLWGDEDSGRLSRIEPIHGWLRFVTHCLRHTSTLQAPAS
jgi:proteasome lid subunit RPN8/RPN11